MRPILPLLVLVLVAAMAPGGRLPASTAGMGPALSEPAPLVTELPGELAARSGPEQNPEARATLVAVAEAWRLGDHEALSRLVSSAGAEIALGPVPGRDLRYSRSQAFYFFKSFFRSRRTESFDLERLQPLAGGERIHAIAGWIWRREGAAEPEAERLLLAMVPEAGGWRLAEIRGLR